MAVTETWLKHNETKTTIADISPPGYSFFHEPRADQRAGGVVGKLVSDQLKTKIHTLPSFDHFTSKPKCMSGSSEPGITIVNPTEISVMYGYVTRQMTTEISVMYGSERVKTFEMISARIGNNSFSDFVVCLYRLQNGTL